MTEFLSDILPLFIHVPLPTLSQNGFLFLFLSTSENPHDTFQGFAQSVVFSFFSFLTWIMQLVSITVLKTDLDLPFHLYAVKMRVGPHPGEPVCKIKDNHVGGDIDGVVS